MTTTEMLDFAELADVVLQEARASLHKVAIVPAPSASPSDAEKFDHMQSFAPLPSREAVASVACEVFWASLLKDEQRFSRMRLRFCTEAEAAARDVLLFEAPRPLDRNELRLLSHVHDIRNGELLWREIEGVPKLVGVRGQLGGESLGFGIRALDPGAIDFSWHVERLVRVEAGRTFRRSDPAVIAYDEAVSKLRTTFFNTVFLEPMLQRIARDGHGGSVWIIDASNEAQGVKIKIPAASNLPTLERFELKIDERPYTTEESSRLIEANFSARKAWLDSLGGLAGTDGALLLDSELRVLGFGAFTSMNLKDGTEIKRVGGGSVEQVISLADVGGARKQSACVFCAANAPAAAWVVSQDGGFSLVVAERHTEVRFYSVADLGFVLR